MNSTTKLNIIYFPLNVLLHATALLPFWALYRISDFLYFVIFHVVRYRVKIVRKNVSESFPEKSEKDISLIVKDFYRHFADFFVETIKLLHISDEEMRRRMIFEGVEIIDEGFDKGRSMMMLAGHYGNWEYITSLTLWSRHSNDDKCVFAQIYRPLRNKWFDTFFLHLRGRFNSCCFTKKSAFRDLIKLKQKGICSITGFISDQHPSGSDVNHVMKFLNHDTAFITGSETIARKLDLDTLYFDLEKIKRGYYKITIRKILFNPTENQSISITDCYATFLEASIKRDPSLWLWTHNRWKHKVVIS
ncbi:MAG: lysophospholipid acyltransferase family protein [Muribaculaceae bacterium]